MPSGAHLTNAAARSRLVSRQMIELSAHDRATSRVRRPETEGPSDPRPLAGIACCMDLPEREEPGPPLEEELPPGYLLDDRFLIRQAIGRSGMATIYKAEDHVGGRDVAVK